MTRYVKMSFSRKTWYAISFSTPACARMLWPWRIQNSLKWQILFVQDKEFLASTSRMRAPRTTCKTGRTTLSLSLYLPSPYALWPVRQKKKNLFLTIATTSKAFLSDGWTTQILSTSIHTNFRMKRKIKIIKSEREERKRKKERDRGKMELGEKEMGCGGIISYCSRISIIQHINTQRCEERLFLSFF